MKPRIDLKVEFYNGNLDFPISGIDGFSSDQPQTIIRVLKLLSPLIGKNNVRLNLAESNRIFIKEFIRFCKEEQIDYKVPMNWEVIKESVLFKIIVNPGSSENIKLLSI